ncbi:septation ring formation regulator EzrA [Salisediminibacterium halotolerans]|uniref:Septation ring formation regulator n=1 Tax=Salisediminibacterium halotolerans TaxID=517425 RepID=A0A1H9V6B5_9BACI|nr:septation ring formation regulator EzrA [Salisediminibacterium haloalkalitolerans]SES17390.1 septation ring formation regulator [Salisediminibacterium haloalkalitolerans]
MLLNILYAVIGIFLIVIIFSAWARRKLYRIVDELENRKIEMMNEPVQEELAKIKGLTMSGETEERFEQWRAEWDHIITKLLPNIEEKLFDVEELANHYRFLKAFRETKQISYELDEIYKQMQYVIEEVKELVESEEQNRAEIDDVKHMHDAAVKKINSEEKNLGGAASVIERELEEAAEQLRSFEDHTASGNYLQAREILSNVKKQIEELTVLADQVPQYLIKLKTDIPGQLSELASGITEMEDDGYPLHHFSFRDALQRNNEKAADLIQEVENLRLSACDEPIREMEDEIKSIYDKLEKEAVARNEFEANYADLIDMTEKAERNLINLNEEADNIRVNYRISDHDEARLSRLEDDVNQLRQQVSAVEDAISEQTKTYTVLDASVKENFAKAEEVSEEIEEVKAALHQLRNEENSANELLQSLNDKYTRALKRLKQTNIPGVPATLAAKCEEAEERLDELEGLLNSVPLSIDDITKKAEEAENDVEEAITQIYHTIHQAHFAESAIQYGNRYRSDNDHVNIILLQAEDRFRNALYDEAVETAIEGIEKVEPDARYKLEELFGSNASASQSK